MASKMEPVNIHDFDFVDELPTESVCGICQFALKDPMQNADCGHRFCTVCFEDFKEYSQKNSQKLLCPMDRSVINSNNVFRDKAAERFILNQKVYCLNNTNGCIWSGELRHHQNHITRCNNKKHKDTGRLLETIEKQKTMLSEKEKKLMASEKARERSEGLVKNLLEKNHCLSKKVENQRSTLHQKEKKLMQQNQLIQKHEEAMKQVAIMEQVKKKEIGNLLKTIEEQETLLSVKEEELTTSEKAREANEAVIDHLKGSNRYLSKRVENQRSTLYQKEQKILEHNQLMKNYAEAMKQKLAVIEQEKNKKICQLSETVERQKVLISNKSQEILDFKKYKEAKEAANYHLNKVIPSTIEEIESQSKKMITAFFDLRREHEQEINKLLRKNDIANKTIVNVENRERRSEKRYNDKLDSIRKRIIVVLIVVFGICLFFDSEGLILISMLFVLRNEIKELFVGTC